MTTNLVSGGRRRLLTLIGGAASAAIAGCTGGGDDGTGTPSDADDDSAAGSCDDLRGSTVSFDPGNRQFPYLFEYPGTFEQYNENVSESPSNLGAHLGHAASGGSTYPVNVAIYQHKGAITDEESATNWVTSFGLGERINWTFTYAGREVEIYQSDVSDDRSRQWRFLLPAHEADGVRGVFVQFQDKRSDRSCIDVLEGISKVLIESLQPNAEYAP